MDIGPVHIAELKAAPSIISVAADLQQPTLDDLERIIDQGKTSFLEVGKALFDIKSRELYKECGFVTWQSYVEVRWQFSRRHAFRLMQAWTEAETLPVGNIPKTEREARARRTQQKEKPAPNAEKLEMEYLKLLVRCKKLPILELIPLLEEFRSVTWDHLSDLDDRYAGLAEF